MGIHKFAPLLGIIGDMGWSYFKVYINIACTRLWNRLIKMDDTRLTKIIFCTIMKLDLKIHGVLICRPCFKNVRCKMFIMRMFLVI